MQKKIENLVMITILAWGFVVVSAKESLFVVSEEDGVTCLCVYVVLFPQ